MPAADTTSRVDHESIPPVHVPVRLGSGSATDGPRSDDLLTRVGAAAGSVTAALALTGALTDVPLPGQGDTASRWEVLAGIAAVDLTVARVLEPHLDALAILSEAGRPATDGIPGSDPGVSTWGVFASEGPASTLTATPVDPGQPVAGSAWHLDGIKPWCSIAGDLTHALITARTPDGPALFLLGLDHPGVRVEPVHWVARGLPAVSSGPIAVSAAPAELVGAPGWYVQRPGFWWGGIGVAACWYGGCVGLARTAYAAALARPIPTAVTQLGRIDVALHTARAALSDAARAIDDGEITDPARLAMRVRAVVAEVADVVLREAAQLLGPGPLAFDEPHARRVADLQLYIRQHHGDRDLAGLGQTLIDATVVPW